jgi:hypothetical protein
MALTPDEAADIARRHGLTVADAASLRALADDTDQADRIAAKFARDADPAKAFVHALFSGTDQTDAPADDPARPAGVVPREGANTQPPEPADLKSRRFIASLFGYDPDHIH